MLLPHSRHGYLQYSPPTKEIEKEKNFKNNASNTSKTMVTHFIFPHCVCIFNMKVSSSLIRNQYHKQTKKHQIIYKITKQ